MSNSLAQYIAYGQDSALLGDLDVAMGDMSLQVSAVVVVDEGNVDQAADLLTEATRWERDVEALRKDWTTPLLDEKKAVDALFKERTAPLRDLTGKLRKALGLYDDEQRRVAEERRQAEIALLREQETARLADAARMADAIDVPVVTIPVYTEQTVAPIAPPATTFTDHGSVGFTVKLSCEVLEPDLVPRSYCVPDERLIRATIRAVDQSGGSRNEALAVLSEMLPGVRVFEESITNVRT